MRCFLGRRVGQWLGGSRLSLHRLGCLLRLPIDLRCGLPSLIQLGIDIVREEDRGSLETCGVEFERGTEGVSLLDIGLTTIAFFLN